MSNKVIENQGVTISPSLIHEGFFNMASQHPERIAVAQREENGGVSSFTYGDIAEKAMHYCGALTGINANGIVAAALDNVSISFTAFFMSSSPISKPSTDSI